MSNKGLISAGHFILNRFTSSVAISGRELIPKTGPIIVASNHPGMTDAMALWTAIDRDDLKIIAADSGLLRLLPNVRKHLILLQPGSSSVMREALAHLKSGGSLLTFPAGKIEPDASLRPGAIESLKSWSPSVEMLARRVPGTVILPVFVQGVLSNKATASPLLRHLADSTERDWAAATLQILLPQYRKVSVRVNFGRPFRGGEGSLASMMANLIIQTKGQTISCNL